MGVKESMNSGRSDQRASGLKTFLLSASYKSWMQRETVFLPLFAKELKKGASLPPHLHDAGRIANEALSSARERPQWNYLRKTLGNWEREWLRAKWRSGSLSIQNPKKSYIHKIWLPQFYESHNCQRWNMLYFFLSHVLSEVKLEKKSKTMQPCRRQPEQPWGENNIHVQREGVKTQAWLTITHLHWGREAFHCAHTHTGRGLGTFQVQSGFQCPALRATLGRTMATTTIAAGWHLRNLATAVQENGSINWGLCSWLISYI